MKLTKFVLHFILGWLRNEIMELLEFVEFLEVGFMVVFRKKQM